MTAGAGNAFTGAAASAADWTTGQFCVPCLQTSGIWCSRTYSYAIISSSTTYQFNNATGANRMMNTAFTALDTAKDNGACCGARTDLQAYINNIDGTAKTTAIASSNTTAGLLKYNGYACAAFSNI